MAVPFYTVVPGFLYRVPASGELSEDPNTEGIFYEDSSQVAWQLQYQPASEQSLQFYVYFYLDGVLHSQNIYGQPAQQAQATTTVNHHPQDLTLLGGYTQANIERLGFIMRGPGPDAQDPGPVVLAWGNVEFLARQPVAKTRVSFTRR